MVNRITAYYGYNGALSVGNAATVLNTSMAVVLPGLSGEGIKITIPAMNMVVEMEGYTIKKLEGTDNMCRMIFKLNRTFFQASFKVRPQPPDLFVIFFKFDESGIPRQISGQNEPEWFNVRSF